MLSIYRHPKKLNQRGFTLIELMVATVVFSIILLVATYGLLQIGRTYDEGLNEVNTQQTAQAALDTISQDIQFNSGMVSEAVNGPAYVICIGKDRYSALMHQELYDNSTSHALIQDATSGFCNPVGSSPNGPIVGLNGATPLAPQVGMAKELLAPSMRLANLSVANIPLGSDLYIINIRVVYGEKNVLCSPTLHDCNNSALTNINQTDLSCKGGVINQFCAVSDLTTTVQRRL
jgi:prepilin-type N-terminal cleavage/methylation domain-containing protein